MAAYSGDVDSALVAKLLADSALMALMPDGVYFDVSPHGKTKVVIVKLMSHTVEQMFGGRAYESPVYLVKAVALGTSGADTKTAAARIDTLLDGGTLTISGYGLRNMQLEEYVRYTEPDPDDDDARWQHRGGMYALMVSS